MQDIWDHLKFVFLVDRKRNSGNERNTDAMRKSEQGKNYIWGKRLITNGVRNQQDETNLSFINIFKSALYVSGDKFAHPQEHFLTVYTAFGIMHRHSC